MSQATVPYGLIPKLFCSLVNSLISEAGEQGRCTSPSCCPHLSFGGAALATAVGSLPTARHGATLQTSKPAFCLIGKAGKAINGSSPAFRKWIRASE